MAEPMAFGPAPIPRHFVLCFDGTGNKFQGDESDSNVLKIFRMLDRSQSHQFHYYQPGIGTYVTTNNLSSTGRFQRIKSAYMKAKDSAVGSSFDQHVMGGYKFLMRYYQPGDEIYFIGFSRGAYIARFLAEMLDYIGLLEAGNEELTRFAWKTFAKWQQRRDDTEEDHEEKRKLFKYMKAFRETFSRPITRIKFMGLFDTVNSVPRFESAWMQRSKFPYTARSSAKVIRHAVGIDERRAKFRQDLISEVKPCMNKKRHHHDWRRHYLHPLRRGSEKPDNVPAIVVDGAQAPENGDHGSVCAEKEETPSLYRSGNCSHDNNKARKISLAVPMLTGSTEDLTSIRSGHSGLSVQIPGDGRQGDDDEASPQDIQEVWFPGAHADIGGGWKLEEGEEWPLSHAPLVWMVQEAQKAGLQLDPRKVKQFECSEEFEGDYSPIRGNIHWNRNGLGHEEEYGPNLRAPENGYPTFKLTDADGKQRSKASSNFLNALHGSSTSGTLHDCLSFGNGLPALSVITWRIMEYLPFRRMDLQEDGSWKPISWPLPCGEVRDIPKEAQIHVSAIRRMMANESYRPGNLIIGGGGRGVKLAPEKYGIGEWVVKDHHGDPVREIYERKCVSKMCKEGDH
ncbi:hypothetical protein BDW42DRAFT_140235 [Aspergillus taichungensis]|uniref:T6SS Phospholipase effector Tle1-like catalytic domain-containing protein n=1 Tax=Aspergillus taichungensis TaxID=482145 RepID=A0A2J5HN18_9EURO|nr:hypothetical protein BDW42DRAFT_140235 [Aspergillus taichungensis]